MTSWPASSGRRTSSPSGTSGSRAVRSTATNPPVSTNPMASGRSVVVAPQPWLPAVTNP